MPIKTDLSVPTYYQRHDPSDDYYSIAFKTGVSVQTRELNDLQAISRTQIERLSDGIYSPGSIVSGCNFLFLNPYPFAKIRDQDQEGNAILPSSLGNNHVLCESTGLLAQVIDTLDGFETSDLQKTIYLNYLNTGDDANTTTFSPGDTLKVFDRIRNGVEDVSIVSGGSGFSNTNSVIAVSPLVVRVTSGSFSNGDYVTNGLGANVQIVGIETSAGNKILRVSPRPADLANSQLDSTAWTVSNGQSVTCSSTGATGSVVSLVGYGYQALPVTDGVGTLVDFQTLNKGYGYTTTPVITLVSPGNLAGYAGLELGPRNYVTKITVSSNTGAIGNGYAFSVTEGVVYLRGLHLRVDPQTIIVSRYDQVPDDVSVGFTASESIVNYLADPNLEDPAAGGNQGAPGADRVRIRPTLALLSADDAEANSGVTPLVEWSQGNPYIQRDRSQYSRIGDEMATHVYDQSGDFFIDPFLVTSREPSDRTLRAIQTELVVDAGSAYVSGRKVETHQNYTMPIEKQLGTATALGFVQSMNYGNYLRLQELGGAFPTDTGGRVELWSQPKNFVSNTSLVASQNTTPQGEKIGECSVRHLGLSSGIPGTDSAVWNLYVFDVDLLAGKNLSDARSVYSNGTNKGIADVVLDRNPTTLLDQAVIREPQGRTLVWKTGHQSVVTVANASYQYLARDESQLAANTGILTKSLASSPGETFPWTGTLSGSQLGSITLVPLQKDLVFSTPVTGTWSVAGSNSATGTSTTALTDLEVGDWVYLTGNTTEQTLTRITGISNNTSIGFSSVASFTNVSALVSRAFPKSLPIPIGYRDGITASVDANSQVLTIDLGSSLTTSNSELVAISTPVLRSGQTPTTKTVNRSGFVRVSTSNNASGPWCVGVPDAFRLRGVWTGAAGVDDSGPNEYQNFSIDTDQTTDQLNLSWLYRRPGTGSVTADEILVELDWYERSGPGFFATSSYTHTSNVTQLCLSDVQPLSNLSSEATTYEVPVFFVEDGQEVDLLGAIDFRPSVSKTVTPASNAASAPTNSSETSSIDGTTKKFPIPGTNLVGDMTYFIPRIDTVLIGSDGRISRRMGDDMVDSGGSPPVPPGMMKIADVLLPEYPQIASSRSTDTTQVMNTGILNTRFNSSRNDRHLIRIISGMSDVNSRRYTNRDVSAIDQRLKRVEYYVSLTTLEASVSQLVVPSSSDPTVNRYQFGFFADDFQTTTLSDLGNPSYAAAIENGVVVPSKLTWEVFGGDDLDGFMSHTQVPIVTQLNSTIGTTGDPTAVPTCALDTANTVAFQLVYRDAFDLTHLAPVEGAVDTVTVTLADNTHMTASSSSSLTTRGSDSWSPNNTSNSTVTLWFYAYDHPVEFELYQGNTLVADSGNAVALTAAEISDLTGTSKNAWFNDQTAYYMKDPEVVDTTYVKWAGKIVWNYSGSGGTSLTVRTTNGAEVRNWRWVLSYPINGDTGGCTPPTTSVHTCPSGYYWSASRGSCVPYGGGGGSTTPPPSGNAVNINWSGCGNSLGELGAQIASVRASGASVGTITVTSAKATEESTSTITASGSVSQWMDPTSGQNKQLLVNDLGWHAADPASHNSDGTIAMGKALDGGSYTYNPMTDTINYTSTSGSTSTVVSSASTAYGVAVGDITASGSIIVNALTKT